ncbi:MAG: hypothetical protein KVP17_002042 [Porospora cf. gigantea B]|uniref:uncharacterized protein n=1 Tax=Porospora cf. gigantea B TaxID=2853592 RepID=UPI003571A901|nr:MAG: hypothetical protein KVP17_002042 [Porospora cf. gigantea B]
MSRSASRVCGVSGCESRSVEVVPIEIFMVECFFSPSPVGSAFPRVSRSNLGVFWITGFKSGPLRMVPAMVPSVVRNSLLLPTRSVVLLVSRSLSTFASVFECASRSEG